LSRWWASRRSRLAAGCGAGTLALAVSLVALVDSSPGHSVTDGDAAVELADGDPATSPDEIPDLDKTKEPPSSAEAGGPTTTSVPPAQAGDRPAEPGAVVPDDPSAPADDGGDNGSEPDPGTGAAPTTSPPTTALPADDASTTPVGGGKGDGAQAGYEQQAPSISAFVASRTTGSCAEQRQVMVKFEWSSTNGTTALVGPQGGASMEVQPTGKLLTCAVAKATWVLTVSGPGGTTSAVVAAPS
jgi:hypothetical protein